MNISHIIKQKFGWASVSGFKIGFLSILLSTFTLIGAISLVIEKSVPRPELSETKKDKKPTVQKKLDAQSNGKAKDNFKKSKNLPVNG